MRLLKFTTNDAKSAEDKAYTAVKFCDKNRTLVENPLHQDQCVMAGLVGRDRLALFDVECLC